MSDTEETKQEIEYKKCPRCKCYREPEKFLNEKGRKLKTCECCRTTSKASRESKQTSAIDKAKVIELIQFIQDRHGEPDSEHDYVLGCDRDIIIESITEFFKIE
jgi:hypothetical protein